MSTNHAPPNPITYDAEPVINVRITNPTPELRPESLERRATPAIVQLQGGVSTGPNQALRLASHIPSRRRLVLTFIGQSTDVVYLCQSQGDAMRLQGCPVMAGPTPMYLENSSEWWVGAGPTTAINIGVISEFVADGRATP